MDNSIKKSPAIEILDKIWIATPYNSHAHLNRTMQSALMLVIDSGIRWEIDDFDHIFKMFRPGYWMGRSSNGQHLGEHYYAAATQNNTSCIKSWEAYFKRTPFILDGQRVYEHFEFKYNDLHCRVTGWNEDNTCITVVAYANKDEKGTRKLLKFDNSKWLEERKSMRAYD